jgi:mevalonate kinase
VAVATIKAVTTLMGLDIDLDEMASLGHRVEVEVQGSASPTDTATATYGGLLFIQPEEAKYDPIESGEIPIVVGYTGDTRSTKVLVDGVKRLRDAHPDIMDPIIEDVGRLTREARARIIAGDDLGDLMNINHGLLEAMGVGSGRLAELVHAARAAGAKGAKITGAGGGGCMIAYAPDAAEEVKKAIEACGCKALIAPISPNGVMLE